MTKITNRKIKMGITVTLSGPNESLFGNGIKQNVISLRDLFAKCDNVSDAFIINVSNTQFPPDYKGHWKEYLKYFISLEEAKNKCDIIVLATNRLNAAELSDIKNRNIKIVNHIMGSELAIMVEHILFEDKPRGLYTRERGSVSATWISPHLFERDRCLFETVNDCPSYEAPYVWDPRFIAADANSLNLSDPVKYPGRYRPSGTQQKRVSVFEPNLDYVKTSLVPMMVCERVFMKSPEAIMHANIFCSDRIKAKKDMIDFATGLDIHRAKKMFFEKRYPITWSLQGHSDIVLSHQNQCELNYLWLDAAWLGYPVVHNSPMMKDLGWYYKDNDVSTAAEHIKKIASDFDNDFKSYIEKSRTYAERFQITNPDNVRGYEKLISALMD